MRETVRKVSLVFSAGAFGGLVTTFFLWIFGYFGILDYFNVTIPYSLPLPEVYTRIVWGGLWGFLFLIPFPRHSYFIIGLIVSLAPTLFQLFVVFPLKAGTGGMGLDYGVFTPLAVLVLNLIWGLSAALWLTISNTRHEWYRKDLV